MAPYTLHAPLQHPEILDALELHALSDTGKCDLISVQPQAIELGRIW
ncbi:hypothetical protein H6F51_10495 [Cyanobacteria bacterium FACHB-DQ100]|nr:hypothetical protein [Cyanobacteria bacterium FACHB-DQ100]